MYPKFKNDEATVRSVKIKQDFGKLKIICYVVQYIVKKHFYFGFSFYEPGTISTNYVVSAIKITSLFPNTKVFLDVSTFCRLCRRYIPGIYQS